MIKYPYDVKILGTPFDPKFELLRLNLGYMLSYTRKMNIIDMISCNDLASTQYCLVNLCKEYLIYLPDGDKVTVGLSGEAGPFVVEWFNTRAGTTTAGGISAGDGKVKFTAPFDSDAFLIGLILANSCLNFNTQRPQNIVQTRVL